ncbi:acetyl esterase, putative [Entamoeba dispar SAW760]|uniref:Acetyl esterase, putative n=1 Tax=Entamoeba dispar (strain ATCC PRA-260 / SAW760) TaxID=370354 RepID=B0ED20_ENTDS|nr:acetyl esterase, putative [Entamoeba dispar SAW760]EDR27437.1 acetyl esterase, putative [Entamoeba dispar SAW760]|eukprot:EDR27437.1 acetyl esterase, putative [Entamoeba dispar SAW760]
MDKLKRIKLIVMLILLLPILLLCHADSDAQKYTIYSNILSQDIEYSVYKPDGYSDEIKYPIVYLLHGMDGDCQSFYQCGMKEILDEYIKNKTIRPTLFVTPNAFNSFYVDKYDGTFNYEKFFFEEFIPTVENLFSVDTNQSNRAIAGISMGGYGAALYSLKHKKLFSACSPMSPALLPENTLELLGDDNDIKKLLLSVFGNEEYFKQNNFNVIVKSSSKGTFTMPYRVCIGKQDYLYQFVIPSKTIMENAEMNNYWYTGDGSHDVDFWKSQIPDTLKFLDQKVLDNTDSSGTIDNGIISLISVMSLILFLII